MKKYLTTIIAVAVLAVVAVAAVVILNVTNKNKGDEPADPTAIREEYVRLFDIYSSDVVKVESSSNGNTFVLEHVAGEDGTQTWKCTSDESIQTYDSSVDSLVSSIVTSSSGVKISNVDDLADYGLSEEKRGNAYITVTDTEGLSSTIYIGNYDFSQSYRYVYLDDGSNNVYKLSVYAVSRMMFQKQDIIMMKAFTYLSTDVPERLIINENGSKILELACTGVDPDAGAQWAVRYPIDRESQNGSVNEIISDMKDIPLNEISGEGVTEEELVNYGLAPAAIEYYLYLRDTENVLKSYMIKVGNKTEDGSYYYCLIAGAEDGLYDVYTVDTRYIYKTINPLDYVNKYLYVKDSDLLSKVEFDISGEHHVMEYEYDTKITTNIKGEETEELVVTRFFDGKEAIDDDSCMIVVSDNRFTVPTENDIALNRDDDITNDIMTANPYETFNHLLLCFYTNFALSEIDLDEPPEEARGELIATVIYTEREGAVYKLELFKRDNTTASAYINGNYAGGYVRTTGFFGDDYAMADFPPSLQALKITMAMIP
ncbi:MAG: DUF4340 domain-containing protein [Clostridia bacterium]|nr:DUF4340 domain-containing protein [Clostridia bacterium]MBO7503987.1 DUF4340 domain-containing protein [Clostridia bacterium]